MHQRLPRSFYLRPTLKIARDLLGMLVVRRLGSRVLVGSIVEVEAYRGRLDPASHAYRGRTPRNAVMFSEGGHLYVYFTYGMHFCANVVTQPEGTGEAVLIRALEPIQGTEIMRKNRGIPNTGGAPRLLTGGPARVCQALRITRRENGTDLLGGIIYLARGTTIPDSRVGRSTRIGITNGADKRWRFFIKDNPYVSR